MGRLDKATRRFVAELLLAFLTGNYRRAAEVHFEAGYVPRDQNPAIFAQALRAIGEALMEKSKAEDISMGGLLEQLFYVTAQFGMQTQPQLLLLQKSMIVVEGVARALCPKLNMWAAAEPILEEWMEWKFGLCGRVGDYGDLLSQSGGKLNLLLTHLPASLERLGERMRNEASHISQASYTSQESHISPAQNAPPAPQTGAYGAYGHNAGMKPAHKTVSFLSHMALWIGALSLAVIAIMLAVFLF